MVFLLVASGGLYLFALFAEAIILKLYFRKCGREERELAPDQHRATPPGYKIAPQRDDGRPAKRADVA